MNKLSAVVTCYNNQETIEKCVRSLSFADEVMVLDSFSSDNTLKILASLNCTVKQQTFKGYAKQKQDAINFANYDWVLLLDSDEFLTTEAQAIIKNWQKRTPNAAAYSLPRREWVFWQWSSPWVRMNKFIRLFNKISARVSNDLVHESIQSSGKVASLNAIIRHYGETSVAVKLAKINKYAELSAQQKFQQGKKVSRLKLVVYPIWYFIKQYFFRRQIFNGRAGFINAKINTQYAYLKYAKLYEMIHSKKSTL